MKCISEGVLRAYADEVLDSALFSEAREHLQDCGTCRLRLERLTRGSAEVHRLMGTLEPIGGFAVVDAGAGYDRFRAMQPVLRTSWLIPRRVWMGLAAGCALVTVLAFAPTRGWAQRVLAMLRVERVAVVPVDMSEVANNGGHGKLAAQFLSDNVVVTMKSGEPVVVGSATEASAAAGFAVRPLPDATASKISVAGPAAFHMTLNRDRLEALLDAAGRSDIPLPANVDGSTVAVYIPKSVGLRYGDIDFMQVPTPTVSVPKTLNMGAIAELGLQVAGMSAGDAHAFASSVDWTSTLVVPIPQAQSSVRTVAVDGVMGTLIEVQGDRRMAASAELVWVRNGVVYSLRAGNAERVLAAAVSLN